MSRSDVVRRLRALSSRGVPISVRYLLPVHADLVAEALAIFGSFDRARQLAGVPAPPLEHDPDVIIGALRSLSRSGVRLDVPTLSTMGESGLVAAAVDTFGSLGAATTRAGLAAAPEPRRAPSGGYGGGYAQPYRDHDRGAPGFAQPPLTADGNVTTALALETLQKTALQLNRVPAARDLPPDVARRLTTDYGSVRFAYLALRVRAEGQGGAERTAEGAAAAAAEPVANISAEVLAATARLPDSAGVHRRNVEAQTAAPAPYRIPAPAPAVAAEPDVDAEVEAEAAPLDDDELAARWPAIEAAIDEAAAAIGARLKAELSAALDRFVDAVTDGARHATFAALVPGGDEEE